MDTGTTETLAAAIERAGSPVRLLRDLDTPPHTFPVTPEFTNWRSEQRAWRDSCALLDQSHHMTDLYLRGPDALRLLADFGVNGFDGFAPGHAKQYVAVNADGFLIGDAILFHLEEGVLDLVGHPTVANWLEYNLAQGGYDATAERDDNSAVRQGPPSVYRYELQGPTAPEILEKATGGPVPEVRFFGMAELTIAGHRVRALRHGMAGRPGFELFGPWAEGEDVLAALLDAGTGGLVRAGAKAYSTANLESGWIPAPVPAIFGDDMADYRAWLPASRVGSLGGSLAADDISAYYVTPYDVGYGRTVRFDHDFHGREALERLAATPDAHRAKVTLVWDPDDVAVIFRSLVEPGTPAKYLELPKTRYAFYQVDQVLVGGEQVGLSMDAGYVTNEQAFLSLATLDAAHAEPGTEVTVLWGEEPNSAKPTVERHRQVRVRATVAPAPYVAEVRARYRRS